MCLWKNILPVYNCDWQMKKKEEIKSAGGQQRFLSLSLFYIYTLYVIGIELIVGIRALGAFCTVIATFLISERDGNFKTKLINLIILVYQISKL